MNDATQAALVSMATTLGTTTTHLWGVLVRQARIDAWLSFGQSVVMVLVAALFFAWLSRQPALEGDEHDVAWAVRIVGAVVSFVLLWIVLFADIPSAITGFYNPEAAAMREVLQAVKP